MYRFSSQYKSVVQRVWHSNACKTAGCLSALCSLGLGDMGVWDEWAEGGRREGGVGSCLPLWLHTAASKVAQTWLWLQHELNRPRVASALSEAFLVLLCLLETQLVVVWLLLD